MSTDCLTTERLRALLRYDSATGEFARLTARRGPQPGPTKSYRMIAVDGVKYYAHRLAWFYVHGAWPSGHTDHINGDRRDNRIANLRDVPERMNHQNLRRPRSDNKLGILGVSMNRHGRFAAFIGADGKTRCLGSFDTPEGAQAAYLAAKREHHPGCTL